MRVIDVVNDWKSHFSAQGMSQRDINSLAQQIDGYFLLRSEWAFRPSSLSNPHLRSPAKPHSDSSNQLGSDPN
jgi:hypothetical protein